MARGSRNQASRLLPGFLGGVIVGALAIGTLRSDQLPRPEQHQQARAERPQQEVRARASSSERYPTADELLGMTDAELATVDPVLMSVMVAKGVPQFADLEVEPYVHAIDEWAEVIRFDTERHWYRFENGPAQFNHSVADYKITWLPSDINTLLQVDYDVLDLDFSDPSNLFITGIVDRRRGTCVSMPMLYVALGWRLGYPIKLVSVPTHVFARWDDGQERINIEATGYGATHPDSWYEERFFVSEESKREGGEMASMTPRQMLGTLVLARCSYWESVGDEERRHLDGLRANLLYPTCPLAITQLAVSWQERWRKDSYAKRAVEHHQDAGYRITERARLAAGEPIERLIAGPNGLIRVIVDPETGELAPVEE